MIRRIIGQRRRSNDISSAGLEQEFPSGPDDPMPVGLTRRIDDVSSAGSEQEFPSGPDDPTPVGLMRRTIRSVLRRQLEDLTATLGL